MKRLLALAFLLLATPAWAQTCPTRLLGDNSNACASTAFVQAAIVINASTYGVKCDGATDDTAAINAALLGAKNKTLLFPPGGSCLVTPGGIVIGAGVANVPAQIIGYGTLIFANTTVAAPLLTIDTPENTQNPFVFQGFVLSCKGAGVSGRATYALKIHGSQNAVYRDLYMIQGCAGGGLWLSGELNAGIYRNLFEHIIINGHTGPGITAKSVSAGTYYISANTWINVSSTFNTTYAIDADWASLEFNGGDWESNGICGPRIDNAIQFDTYSVHIEANNAVACAYTTTANTKGLRVNGGRTIGTITASALTSPANSFLTSDVSGNPLVYISGNQFTTAGDLNFASGVGITIAGAAASGNVLRGNGTRFVSAQLAAADLSNGTTGSGSVVLSGSPTLTGTLTAPTVAGGSAAGSTLALASTTNAGTTDSIIFQTGSQVQRGFINTTGQWLIGSGTVTVAGGILTLSANTAGSLPTAGGPRFIDFFQADANGANLKIWGAGAAGSNGVVKYLTSGGTIASPTATQSADTLGANFAFGYGTSYQTGGGAGFQMTAAQTFTVANGGAQIDILTTPLNTVTNAISTRFFPSGGVGIGETGTDPGIGALQLNAQFFMPNITQSSAAQTGTVCWTTGTGKFTVDTTVGCLTSIGIAKNVVGDLAPALALRIVDEMHPISFRYRPGYGDSGQYEQFGFIAEEIATIDERMVGRDTEGNLSGVRYMELTAVLAAAIKELKNEVRKLQH